MKINKDVRSSLYRRSIEIIKKHQSAGGAYVASPNFPTYHYCWLRDGAFIAHSMDRVGEYGSAGAFFRWVGAALGRCAGKAERLLARLARGEAPAVDEYLHTRFTLDGHENSDPWSNFQLDGYGTWLWALREHVRLAGDASLAAELAPAVRLSVRYLAALWPTPSFDCWEEHPEYVHLHTLAAIYGGLAAAAELPGGESDPAIRTAIRDLVLARAVPQGRLVESLVPGPGTPPPQGFDPTAVDASLLGAIVPYGLLAAADPIARATVAAIESDLHRPGGGVYRYRADTYYGGGEWTLLAAWLGWYYAETGNPASARAILRWVEAQADAEGCLPEQVSGHLLAPERYAEWEQRWGPVAKPLLWSHAMYLILADALETGS